MQSKRINWVFGKIKLCMSQNIVKKVKKITLRVRESLQIIVCLVYYRTLTSQYKWLTLFAGSKASLWIFLRKVHRSQTYTVDIFIEKGTHTTNMYLEKVYFYQLFGDVQNRYWDTVRYVLFPPGFLWSRKWKVSLGQGYGEMLLIVTKHGPIPVESSMVEIAP